MRTERVVFFFVAIFGVLGGCSLLAPPGEYGSEYSNGEGPRDASSEDGG